MTIDPTTAYRLLGLHPGATRDEVKTAFRDLAQVWHPDRFPENDRLREKALHNQQLLNEAYALLRDHRPPAVQAQALEPGPGPVAVAPMPIRNLKYSFFTGVSAVRNSLEVLWPSATYARKRRRRRPPLARIALVVLGLLLAAAAVAALWRARLLRF
jgi:curved DNA-binding protein CbpA